MEHRIGTRHPVAVEIVLHPMGKVPLVGCTREVSISGMFVEAPPQHLPLHSLVELELTLPVALSPRTFRWQAMVIRRTDNGVGLMFDRLRPPAITRLLANERAAADSASRLVSLSHAGGARTPTDIRDWRRSHL